MKRMLQAPWETVISLLQGLWVTGRQLWMKPFTVQYPQERLVWPPRSRGRLLLPQDPQTQANRCTACLLCQRLCPNGSIEITVRPSADGKRELSDYLYHWDRCTLCGVCVEGCPFDALRLSHEHEMAVEDKTALKLHLQTEFQTFDPAWEGGLPESKSATP